MAAQVAAVAVEGGQAGQGGDGAVVAGQFGGGGQEGGGDTEAAAGDQRGELAGAGRVGGDQGLELVVAGGAWLVEELNMAGDGVQHRLGQAGDGAVLFFWCGCRTTDCGAD